MSATTTNKTRKARPMTTTKTKPATKPTAKTPVKKKAAPVPEVKPAPTGGTLTLSATLLKKIINVVTPAASTDEARPLLCNLRIEPGTSSVEFVATDSYRLHVLDVPGLGCTSEHNATINIPAWWLRRWARTTKTRRVENATLTWTNEAATISTEFGDVIERLRLAPIDPTQPWVNWRGLVDKITEGQALAAFNPKYLAATLAACARWSSEWVPVVLDPLKPGMFRSRSSEGVLRAVLTPVLTSDTTASAAA